MFRHLQASDTAAPQDEQSEAIPEAQRYEQIDNLKDDSIIGSNIRDRSFHLGYTNRFVAGHDGVGAGGGGSVVGGGGASLLARHGRNVSLIPGGGGQGRNVVKGRRGLSLPSLPDDGALTWDTRPRSSLPETSRYSRSLDDQSDRVAGYAVGVDHRRSLGNDYAASDSGRRRLQIHNAGYGEARSGGGTDRDVGSSAVRADGFYGRDADGSRGPSLSTDAMFNPRNNRYDDQWLDHRRRREPAPSSPAIGRRQKGRNGQGLPEQGHTPEAIHRTGTGDAGDDGVNSRYDRVYGNEAFSGGGEESRGRHEHHRVAPIQVGWTRSSGDRERALAVSPRLVGYDIVRHPQIEETPGSSEIAHRNKGGSGSGTREPAVGFFSTAAFERQREAVGSRGRVRHDSCVERTAGAGEERWDDSRGGGRGVEFIGWMAASSSAKFKRASSHGLDVGCGAAGDGTAGARVDHRYSGGSTSAGRARDPSAGRISASERFRRSRSGDRSRRGRSSSCSGGSARGGGRPVSSPNSQQQLRAVDDGHKQRASGESKGALLEGEIIEDKGVATVEHSRHGAASEQDGEQRNRRGVVRGWTSIAYTSALGGKGMPPPREGSEQRHNRVSCTGSPVAAPRFRDRERSVERSWSRESLGDEGDDRDRRRENGRRVNNERREDHAVGFRGQQVDHVESDDKQSCGDSPLAAPNALARAQSHREDQEQKEGRQRVDAGGASPGQHGRNSDGKGDEESDDQSGWESESGSVSSEIFPSADRGKNAADDPSEAEEPDVDGAIATAQAATAATPEETQATSNTATGGTNRPGSDNLEGEDDGVTAATAATAAGVCVQGDVEESKGESVDGSVGDGNDRDCENSGRRGEEIGLDGERVHTGEFGGVNDSISSSVDDERYNCDGLPGGGVGRTEVNGNVAGEERGGNLIEQVGKVKGVDEAAGSSGAVGNMSMGKGKGKGRAKSEKMDLQRDESECSGDARRKDGDAVEEKMAETSDNIGGAMSLSKPREYPAPVRRCRRGEDSTSGKAAEKCTTSGGNGSTQGTRSNNGDTTNHSPAAVTSKAATTKLSINVPGSGDGGRSIRRVTTLRGGVGHVKRKSPRLSSGSGPNAIKITSSPWSNVTRNTEEVLDVANAPVSRNCTTAAIDLTIPEDGPRVTAPTPSSVYSISAGVGGQASARDLPGLMPLSEALRSRISPPPAGFVEHTASDFTMTDSTQTHCAAPNFSSLLPMRVPPTSDSAVLDLVSPDVRAASNTKAETVLDQTVHEVSSTPRRGRGRPRRSVATTSLRSSSTAESSRGTRHPSEDSATPAPTNASAVSGKPVNKEKRISRRADTDRTAVAGDTATLGHPAGAIRARRGGGGGATSAGMAAGGSGKEEAGKGREKMEPAVGTELGFESRLGMGLEVGLMLEGSDGCGGNSSGKRKRRKLGEKGGEPEQDGSVRGRRSRRNSGASAEFSVAGRAQPGTAASDNGKEGQRVPKVDGAGGGGGGKARGNSSGGQKQIGCVVCFCVCGILTPKSFPRNMRLSSVRVGSKVHRSTYPSVPRSAMWTVRLLRLPLVAAPAAVAAVYAVFFCCHCRLYPRLYRPIFPCCPSFFLLRA